MANLSPSSSSVVIPHTSATSSRAPRSCQSTLFARSEPPTRQTRRKCSFCSTNINFKWRFECVRRQYNSPADELANAVMDDRQPCRDIVAYEPQAAVTLQEDALRRLWDLARAKRVPLFHRLPYEAIPVWKQVCDLILSHEAFRLSRLATLLLAPLALLQRNKDNIKQRLMRMVARPQLITEAYYRAAQQDTEPEARRPRRDTSIEGAVEVERVHSIPTRPLACSNPVPLQICPTRK
jgi:hypothetical protein